MSERWPAATTVGGGWAASDQYVDSINAAATEHGVPANLIRSILNRESSGVWSDAANPTDKYRRRTPDGSINWLMGFAGIYETTAATWGCDWRAMATSPAAQLRCMATGLARLSADFGGWENAATVYFGGPDALKRVVVDETGMRSDVYAGKALADWRALDKLSEGASMVLPIRQSFIPAGNPNRPGTKLNVGPLWITVHETGNTRAGADAEMHRVFTHQGGGESIVSFHFVVDDREAIQLLPCDEIGWHASDGCNDRAADTGCFASVAIETCVNADGDWTKTFANLAELIAAIVKGDGRVAFAGRAGAFSAARIAQHNRWAFDRKNCPQRIRERGLWDGLLAAVNARIGGSPPAPGTTKPPATPPADAGLPPGVDLALASAWFGKVVKDGLWFRFDPAGSISRAWIAHGRETGQWPALVDVGTYQDSATSIRRYFRFEGGLTLLHATGQPVRVVKGDAP